ncbi:hypothetical protein D920_01733 [Enterococcus faecalis 13-SD-W-01]|nr:hypothetical protein D920_01733 [Enterococcus faecalis 13-SD-W-01]
MKTINNYFWFIRESQAFMQGYNPVVVFFKSLYKGFGFCKMMKGS